MICTFSVMGFRRSIETNASAFVFSEMTGLRRIAWDDIEGAGPLAFAGIKLPENFPTLLAPGTGIVNKLAADYGQVWVAHRKGRRVHMAYLRVPRKDLPEFAAEFRNRIGPRWSDEARDALTVRKQFGKSNWWVPVVSLGLMPVVGIVLFAYWAILVGIWTFFQRLAHRYWLLVALAVVAAYGYRKFRGRS
jgi:hypothetical protein